MANLEVESLELLSKCREKTVRVYETLSINKGTTLKASITFELIGQCYYLDVKGFSRLLGNIDAFIWGHWVYNHAIH